jgi:uncharacterized OsmC-like protein
VEIDLNESRFFDMRFRAVVRDLKNVRIFTGKDSFESCAQMTFDAEYQGITCVEYFLGSIMGSILLSLLERAQQEHVCIEEMEGQLSAKLENPLSFLHVQGYAQEPGIGDIEVIVYLYADMEEEALLRFCNETLAQCPVYNLIKKTGNITVSFRNSP